MGFTDCLLAHGAAHVVAVDVGHGQLLDRLRRDPRVEVVERANVRYLGPADLGGRRFDVVVADLSFISLMMVAPALIALAKPAADLVGAGEAAVRGGPRRRFQGQRGGEGPQGLGERPVRRRRCFRGQRRRRRGRDGFAASRSGRQREFFLHLRGGAEGTSVPAGVPTCRDGRSGPATQDRPSRDRPLPDRRHIGTGRSGPAFTLARSMDELALSVVPPAAPTAVAAGANEMARIGFAPHAERPKAVKIAKSVGAWLAEQGHKAVFLDEAAHPGQARGRRRPRPAGEPGR